MTAYIIRRLMQAVIVILSVTAFVFFAMRLMPGDPVLIYLSKEQYNTLTPEQVEQTRVEFGLDKPIVIQYFNWLGNTVTGDLGYSLSERVKVGQLLGARLPVTLYLGVIAFVVGNVLGIVAGMICAVRRGKLIDLIVTLLANFGITIPTFWLAIVLLYVFSLHLGWLPTHGFSWPTENFSLSIQQTIMPVI
jgi:peptide/nickel transport system permease protein